MPDSAALGRKPLPVISAATKAHVESECAEIIALERELEAAGYVGLGLRQGEATAAPGKKSGTNGIMGSIKQKVAAI